MKYIQDIVIDIALPASCQLALVASAPARRLQTPFVGAGHLYDRLGNPGKSRQCMSVAANLTSGSTASPRVCELGGGGAVVSDSGNLEPD